MVDESRVVSEVVARVIERVVESAGKGGHPVDEVVNETLYRERERLKKTKGDRADDDRRFYAKVQAALPKSSAASQKELLGDVVRRYAAEVSGHFDPRVYRAATGVLPYALSGLVTGLSPRRLLFDRSAFTDLDQHLVVEGELEHVRRLRSRGTLLFTPTHSSNLDSVLMGWAVYRAGLPPVTYGAGLNLFSNPLIGYFMNHLGAYTVDRTKTDPLYRDVLKEYATVTLEMGQDGLFFPGGTRSRSGAVETHLKKGLLGTSLAAYRNNLKAGKTQRERVFVVPVSIGYPLVLEAQTLVEDYLAEAGKSRYIIVDDEFSEWQRWLAFMRGLMELDVRIHIRFGRALDPFGNDVDDEGESLDPRGRTVDPARYLMHAGTLVDDPARDAEYTTALAARIVKSFASDNLVQPTHAAAFVALELFRRRSAQPDLYRFLRTLGPDSSLPQTEVEQALSGLLDTLRQMSAAGQIKLARDLETGDAATVLRAALRSFGTYHQLPALERRGIRLHVGDPKLLFYYRNRLDQYGLLGTSPLVAGKRSA